MHPSRKVSVAFAPWPLAPLCSGGLLDVDWLHSNQKCGGRHTTACALQCPLVWRSSASSVLTHEPPSPACVCSLRQQLGMPVSFVLVFSRMLQPGILASSCARCYAECDPLQSRSIPVMPRSAFVLLTFGHVFQARRVWPLGVHMLPVCASMLPPWLGRSGRPFVSWLQSRCVLGLEDAGSCLPGLRRSCL